MKIAQNKTLDRIYKQKNKIYIKTNNNAKIYIRRDGGCSRYLNYKTCCTTKYNKHQEPTVNGNSKITENRKSIIFFVVVKGSIVFV